MFGLSFFEDWLELDPLKIPVLSCLRFLAKQKSVLFAVLFEIKSAAKIFCNKEKDSYWSICYFGGDNGSVIIF